MQSKPTSSKRPRGFSLVELLIVIAVLGVIASLALISFGDVNGVSRSTIAKAQAQRIASVFGAGKATGAPGFVIANSVTSAMNAVGIGSAGSGGMGSMFFKLGGISGDMDDNKPLDEQAKHYLSWQSGTLVYKPDGGAADANHYESFDQWVAALNAAMSAWWNAHPGASEAETSAYFQTWTQNNPQPPNEFL